ncbi:MAG: hypothetical protein Q4P24_01560, partial [Rhodobacterales bacterium]|nr:hypothetical protein [Rhodobacterales bacterium]
DGAMNREMFDLYVTPQLVRALRTGDVVILDNLSSHKSPCAARALRDIGAWFLFLPPGHTINSGRPLDTEPIKRDTL